jgi:hypothetical protein
MWNYIKMPDIGRLAYHRISHTNRFPREFWKAGPREHFFLKKRCRCTTFHKSAKYEFASSHTTQTTFAFEAYILTETSASSGRTKQLFHRKSTIDALEHVLNVVNSYLAYWPNYVKSPSRLIFSYSHPAPAKIKNDLVMRNTIDVTGGEPIAIWSQFISGVSAVNQCTPCISMDTVKSRNKIFKAFIIGMKMKIYIIIIMAEIGD